jgi:2-methylcitrate dehydratase PrpD
MTLSRKFAEFAAGLRYDSIPREVIEIARLRLLDTVGVCLASTGMDYARAALDTVLDQGGRPESTLYGAAPKTNAAWAAFYNGALAHGNDYDDTHPVAIMHVSGVIVPTMLALGERLRTPGPAALAAAVAGYEIGIRIGMGAPTEFHARGFHPTSVCGVFSAAVTASHLLGLDAACTAHALGIAGSQAAGSMEFLADGAWTKRMHPGWAAHAGVIAAQLAARGYTGPAAVLEGRYGLYRAYAGAQPPSAERLCANLGREWEVLNVDFKPYPCGHISHPYMDCARDLRDRHGLKAFDIAEIELRVPPAAVPILCEPLADKLRPASAYAARFSLPYAVAVILVLGRAGIDEFSEARIRDPEILALAARCRYEIDTTLPFPGAFPGWIRIRLNDGRLLESRRDTSRGSRQTPMSADELYEKFEANVNRAMPAGAARRLWDAGLAFETLASVEPFTRLLAGHEQS